ncbi:hypothetical protein DFA_02126 [Cavenderia fasciculata]|uniref:Uncharacterized protein n=1 Tax=Cavenderia fasciculata TaxID=261658 RepID=F4PYS3_CACFS|nr:uncharacterized protein DFA_02126 [Cavenderia fasciculata]EGG19339.1 hypothetical protein DFA_02126 [Cavenderia fasciculata]|eukprot:XP_004357610.1 hypothetical protein DFA_02126 [Cavenderia fasciculata]
MEFERMNKMEKQKEEQKIDQHVDDKKKEEPKLEEEVEKSPAATTNEKHYKEAEEDEYSDLYYLYLYITYVFWYN